MYEILEVGNIEEKVGRYICNKKKLNTHRSEATEKVYFGMKMFKMLDKIELYLHFQKLNILCDKSYSHLCKYNITCTSIYLNGNSIKNHKLFSIN